LNGRLDPRDIVLIAQEVARLIGRDGPPNSDALIAPKEVAAMLGCRTSWVYENAARLGAIRLGDGPKARLRFRREDVLEAIRVTTPVSGRREPQGLVDGISRASSSLPRRRRRRPVSIRARKTMENRDDPATGGGVRVAAVDIAP
jgi:hypothetical protein